MNEPYIANGVGFIPVRRHGSVVAWAQVDEEAFSRVSGEVWSLHTLGYIQRRASDGTTVFLHREVLGLPPGNVPAVHFRDRTTFLDCRRSNLLVARRWVEAVVMNDPLLRDVATTLALAAAATGKAAA